MATIRDSSHSMLMNKSSLGPRQGRGTIVNVASMYGIIAPAASLPLTPYTATKHGNKSFLESVDGIS
jgi:NAD(P)-dependent dehydrogenase (short-subunit alcohol dehydrogenase family)